VTETKQRGFTLVELMVSLVIFTFAIAGVLSVAVAMTRAYREQRRVIATENAVRAPLDFIVDALRQASPGVATATIKDANDCSFSGAAISMVDNDDQPDELTVVYASGGIVSTTHSAFISTSSSIAIPASQTAQFAIGDYVLVTDTNEGTLVKVTAVNAASLSISITCATAFPAGGYPSGSILVRAQRARFVIADLDNGAGQPVPTLWMYPNGVTDPDDAEPVAEGVEDLQVALGVDADANGAIADGGLGSTTDEWIGNASGDVLPTGSIRAVQVALVSRDTAPLTGVAGFYQPAQALNHDGNGSADNFRRRMLSTIVEIRNLTGSP
jgi:prepilin-type N-terminal cleavage/methylation domain-containing protein